MERAKSPGPVADLEGVAESGRRTGQVRGSECHYWNFNHKNSILHSAARVIFVKGESDHVISLLYTLQRLPFAPRIQLRIFL